MVTSTFMCHGKRGGGSIIFVPVREDGEEDAFHGGAVPEDAHGPCPSPDPPEASFDGVCSPHLPAFIGRGVSEAGGKSSGSSRRHSTAFG